MKHQLDLSSLLPYSHHIPLARIPLIARYSCDNSIQIVDRISWCIWSVFNPCPLLVASFPTSLLPLSNCFHRHSIWPTRLYFLYIGWKQLNSTIWPWLLFIIWVSLFLTRKHPLSVCLHVSFLLQSLSPSKTVSSFSLFPPSSFYPSTRVPSFSLLHV